MKKLSVIIPLSIAIPTLMAGCSDFTTDLQGDSALNYGNEANTLLTCNKELDGKVVKPVDSKNYRLCKDGQWFAVDIDDFDEKSIYIPVDEASSSSSEDETPTSSSANDKVSYTTSSASADPVAPFFECADGTVVNNSENCGVITSSEDETPTSSSANDKISYTCLDGSVVDDFKKCLDIPEPTSSANADPVDPPIVCANGTIVINSENCDVITSSEDETPTSSSANDKISYTCLDGSVVDDFKKCLDMPEPTSSANADQPTFSSATVPVSSAEANSSDSPASSAEQIPSSSAVAPISSAEATSSDALSNIYDCSKYDCVTTEHLNPQFLEEGRYGEFLDSRDNQVYRTIKIGEQTWLAQNLNYDVVGSHCLFDKPEKCEKYGRLYLWSTAIDSAGVLDPNGPGLGCGGELNCSVTGRVQGVCPEGWHIPTSAEWSSLFKSVGGDSIAGLNMKTSTNGWSFYGETTRGSDPYGFAAASAGEGKDNEATSAISFYYEDRYTTFWSSSNNGSNRAIITMIRFNEKKISDGGYSRSYYFSVRCLKD